MWLYSVFMKNRNNIQIQIHEVLVHEVQWQENLWPLNRVNHVLEAHELKRCKIELT